MNITVENINEILKQPVHQETIHRASQLEQRIRFHATTFNRMSETFMPCTHFLNWVQEILSKDKFNVFLTLFRFPLVTIPFINDLFADMEKVFDGKDPETVYNFIDDSFLEDWETYRMSTLHSPQIWREKGWEIFRYAINSIVVVECQPTIGISSPMPFFYFLSINDVVDYALDGKDFEWILFRSSADTVKFIDDNYYREYQLQEANGTEVTTLIMEVLHGLNYCPVRFFWSDQLNPLCPEIKKSPLSPYLSNLDWLLFFVISKKHLDLYAPYPIYSSYQANCDFKNNETGDYCDGGYLRNQNDQYRLLYDGNLVRCPVCHGKRLTGAGSMVEVPIPVDGIPDMKSPVTITSVDKDSLDYNVEEIERLKQEIRDGVTGKISDVMDKTSVDDGQIQSSYENRTAVLNNLKRNFEEIQKFTEDTICILRYGDSYLGSSISLGGDFFIYTLENLTQKYMDTKANHLDISELDRLSGDITAQRYKNAPEEHGRMKLLKELEPYPHYNFNEIMQMNDRCLLDKDAVVVKLHFSDFIKKFELENKSVTDFGQDMPYAGKIAAISEKLKHYARTEVKRPRPKPQTGSGGGGEGKKESNGSDGGSGSDDKSDNGKGNMDKGKKDVKSKK